MSVRYAWLFVRRWFALVSIAYHTRAFHRRTPGMRWRLMRSKV